MAPITGYSKTLYKICAEIAGGCAAPILWSTLILVQKLLHDSPHTLIACSSAAFMDKCERYFYILSDKNTPIKYILGNIQVDNGSGPSSHQQSDVLLSFISQMEQFRSAVIAMWGFFLIVIVIVINMVLILGQNNLDIPSTTRFILFTIKYCDFYSHFLFHPTFKV